MVGDVKVMILMLVASAGDRKIYAFKNSSKGLANSPWPMRGQNARHTGRVMNK
jgi:hypothetical protein